MARMRYFINHIIGLMPLNRKSSRNPSYIYRVLTMAGPLARLLAETSKELSPYFAGRLQACPQYATCEDDTFLRVRHRPEYRNIWN